MRKYMKYAAAFLMAGAVSACTDNFDEINTDPNQPPVVPTSALLTSAQKQLMDHTWDATMNGQQGMQLAQFWASNQYSDESRYAFRSATINNYWLYFYAGRGALDGSTPNGGGMQDLNEIIRLNTEFPDENAGSFGTNANQIAVANTLKVWIMQVVTDIWGNAPYSQALNIDEYPNPAYDSQEDIYNTFLSQLTDASNSVELNGLGPAGDAIYSGDMMKWKKFINSLKLRVAMRMADAAPSVAQTAVAEAVEAGVFESNDDNALFPYLMNAPNNNPLNENFKTRNDYAVSNILIDKLQDLSDPRLALYAAPTVNSVVAGTPEYVGEVYGLDEVNAAATQNDDISQRPASILAADAPGIYMQYAEVTFLLAEAVERGFISGSAADYYNMGVAASMNYWNDGSLTQDDIDAYLAQPAVAYDAQIAAGTLWNEVIGQQKWLSLYMQGIEAWTEYRRLDFGVLQMPADGVLDGTGIPLRIMYPLDEQSANKASYDAAVAAQGPDALDTRLWWDTK
ncbi:MAG: SusD/RagB family nutrient-binding outer membrane lipoprotein [Bacteroidota bacterium]